MSLTGIFLDFTQRKHPLIETILFLFCFIFEQLNQPGNPAVFPAPLTTSRALFLTISFSQES
jgi:hypothetical protein